MRKIILVGLLIALVLSGGCIDKGGYLRMVMTPEGSPIEEKVRWQPVVDYLQEEIGIQIVMKISTDYSAAIIALDTGYADIAKLGPFSYILAVEATDIEPLVRGVRIETGLPYQVPYIFVRTDSGLETLQDLKGKTFAFVDVASTSGYLVPMAAFAKEGIDPETFFSRVYFAGSHDLAVQAVKEGKVDAGCSNNLIYNLAIKEGIIEEDELKVIVEGNRIPTDPTVVRKDMDPEIKQKLLDAYLNMPTELSTEAFGESKYIRTEDGDYDSIREVAKLIGIE